MIYYVCKYTPIEPLEGFGGECARLEPLPDNFDTADSLGHPNMCGYGKAIIEEVFSKDIKEMVLVDCCDVIRRVYDILEESGRMDFLWLLELPHKRGWPKERYSKSVSGSWRRATKNTAEGTLTLKKPWRPLRRRPRIRRKSI